MDKKHLGGRPVKAPPNPLELIDKLNTLKYAEVAKYYNVSVGAVQKWCKQLDISLRWV
jgi:hypothetical protein